MSLRSDNYEPRLASLRKSISAYAAELSKLESDAEVTPNVTSYFGHLFSQAVNLGMTEAEIRLLFVPLTTPMTVVADTNPKRGYWKWSTNEQKNVWVQVD